MYVYVMCINGTTKINSKFSFALENVFKLRQLIDNKISQCDSQESVSTL